MEFHRVLIPEEILALYLPIENHKDIAEADNLLPMLKALVSNFRMKLNRRWCTEIVEKKRQSTY
ncbi:MAG: hypothetical protein PVF15_00180 [Candidatus Bathyarchaeota archaeon]|jgi:hypothetical protein